MGSPLAVYRMQFGPSFPLAAARELVDYLHDLGVTHLFASPLLQARAGSPHGYDVTDPRTVNPEVGGREGLRALVAALRDRGMGLLLDLVPNHMAASHENPWWWDVLARGPASPHARTFDIEWDPPSVKGDLRNRVLLPVLARPYGEVLEAGELVLDLGDRGLEVRYGDRRFPVSPPSHRRVLATGLERVPPAVRARAEEALEAFLAPAGPDAPETLARLVTEEEAVRRVVEAALEAHRGTPGEAASFDRLDRLLGEQAYRLAYWRRAEDEINYRRFFSLSDLVGVRVEDPSVFDRTHGLVLDLVREGLVDGLRVDHVDGLSDPTGYLEALCGGLEAVGSAYVVVEKILAEDEDPPEEWPVAGTTGYEFLNAANDLLVHPEGLADLDRVYRRFTGREEDFDAVHVARQREILRRLFAGELRALTRQLARLAAPHRHARDLTLETLVTALVEVTARLPVYRTYVRSPTVSTRDRRVLRRALEAAERAGEADDRALRFLGSVLLLDPPAYLAERREEWLAFVMRWQQLTGPVMAKGVEDTAFYVYNRLVSMNEVGGDPRGRRVPRSRRAFHRLIALRGERWPGALTATSTHDTKRSEDVRARLDVLAEMPEEWGARLEQWHAWNLDHRTAVDGGPVPGPNTEVLLYQTLLGAWPLDPDDVPEFRERLRGYVVKAAREAKVHTSWRDPRPRYEEALVAFADAVTDEERSPRFLRDFRDLHATVARYGALNSLVLALLKAASPGVPNVYQGTELWDFSLVDPDNRRPVDFALRRRRLQDLREREARKGREALARDLLARWRDGDVKLYVLATALGVRRETGALLTAGEYRPLEAAGPREAHALGFARRHGNRWAVAASGRWFLRLAGRPDKLPRPQDWGDTTLRLPPGAPRRWVDVFTERRLEAEGDTLDVADVLAVLPVGLLRPA